MDLTPIETMLGMAGGIFLCWMVLEAGGPDSKLKEIEFITNRCQAFSTAPITRDEHRVNKAVHKRFQEHCTCLRTVHLWRGGSALRLLREHF